MFEELYPETAERPIAAAIAITRPSEVDLEKLDLEGLALAKFDASRAASKAAAEKLTDVVHDLSTPSKIADAKSLRERLINAPLAEARKVEKALKSKLSATSKAVGAALVTIEADFAAASLLITPQIEARDAELAAEKAERERKEAERVAAHQANLSKIAGYPAQLQGKTSEQIQAAAIAITNIAIDPAAWEEFADAAAGEKARTLIAVNDLYFRTRNAEDEAATREAQRIENERKAAELAAREAEMAAKQAELDAKLAAIAAAEKADADRKRGIVESGTMFLLADQSNAEEFWSRVEANASGQVDHPAMPDQLSDDALAAMPSIADAVPSVDRPAAVPLDMDEVANQAWHFSGRMTVSTGVLLPTESPIQFAERPAASNEPTLTLGALNARFGVFSINAEGLAALGFQPIATKKAAKLYSEAQFLAIADAIVERIGEIVCACES